MRKIHFAATILAAALVSTSYAQTVTVDASNGSPDNVSTFSSLSLAIKSFQANGSVAASTDGGGVGVNHGNAAADVIDVVATAVVDESVVVDLENTASSDLDYVVLDEALTIQGSGGQAIIALKQNPNAAAGVFNDCGFSWRQNTELTLKDLIFIPSLANAPTDDALYFRQPTAVVDCVVNVDNIVVTSNDGSNAPVTIDGKGNPDLTLATTFGDDGVYVVSRTEGGSITFNATNMVISAFNTSTASGRDALLVFMNGATNDIVNAIANIGEGCVISNVLRFGIQNPYGGEVNIAGTAANPVIFNNIGADAIWNSSDGVGQATVLTVDHAVFNNVTGTAIKEQETNDRGFIASVSNTRIANCGGPGIELYSAGALDPGAIAASTVNVSNVTVHSSGTTWFSSPSASYDFLGFGIGSPFYNSANKSNRDLNLSEVIVSGSGLTGLYNTSDGSLAADYVGLPTAGTWALAAATAGTSTINATNVTNAGIEYMNVSNPFEEDFLGVRSVQSSPSPYETAGPGGAALTGGGQLYQITILGTTDTWNLYN